MISVSVEDDPPPIVRAVAKDLAAHLEDPSFAEATAGLAGAIAVKDTSTPQALTLRLGDGRVSLAHGAATDADLSATVAFEDGSEAEPEFEPDAEHPELARWLSSVLEAPAMSWPEAADRFWSVLERMSGAPEALLVTDLESGEQHRCGAEDGRAYEIEAAPRALIDVLSGRVPLIDAAFGGAVLVRGSFPELSLLTGAGFTVRYGGEGWDG